MTALKCPPKYRHAEEEMQKTGGSGFLISFQLHKCVGLGATGTSNTCVVYTSAWTILCLNA